MNKKRFSKILKFALMLIWLDINTFILTLIVLELGNLYIRINELRTMRFIFAIPIWLISIYILKSVYYEIFEIRKKKDIFLGISYMIHCGLISVGLLLLAGLNVNWLNFLK